MGEIQHGLHTLVRNKPSVTVARYQETKIRHFHALWDQYLAPNQVEGGPKSSGRAAG